MCKWSLFDWLTFESLTSDSLELVVGKHQRLEGQSIPSDERNLVIKALRLIRDLAGKSVGATIRLFKNIPVEAGMGGASSNAAAAILAANQIWQLNWPSEKLHSVAEQIGSDVAFFLGGCFAKCVGKGEQVHNLNYPCRLNIVVAKPRGGLSTSQIYSRCVTPKQPITSDAILAGLRTGQGFKIGRAMFNRLEQFAQNDQVDIAKLRTEFGKTNCMGHQLTGSGSCYFGIYPNVRSMRVAARQLMSRLPGVNVMTGQTLCSRNIGIGTFER